MINLTPISIFAIQDLLPSLRLLSQNANFQLPALSDISELIPKSKTCHLELLPTFLVKSSLSALFPWNLPSSSLHFHWGLSFNIQNHNCKPPYQRNLGHILMTSIPISQLHFIFEILGKNCHYSIRTAHSVTVCDRPAMLPDCPFDALPFGFHWVV